MEITLFAKKRTTKDGKVFHQYLSTLEKRDGTTETVRVAFRNVEGNNIPKAESCPRNIAFNKEDALLNDVRVCGFRKPGLDLPQHQKRLDKYIAQFNALVEQYKNEE